MGVNVRIPPMMRKCTNGQELVEVAGSTASEVLGKLTAEFPKIRRWLYDKQGTLRPQLQFYLNKERLRADDLGRALHDGDELLILVAIAGG